METIVSLFRGRRSDQFEELIAPHIEHLYRLAYRFTGSRNDAEDLMQDLLVKLYPRAGELARVEALRPWLARALYHQFIDGVRRARRDPLSGSEDEEALASHASSLPGGERLLETAQLRDQLIAALTTLNEDQRALITLHDVEGYTLTELEAVLDTPLGTLKSRLHRARARMRRALGADPRTEPSASEMRLERQENMI